MRFLIIIFLLFYFSITSQAQQVSVSGHAISLPSFTVQEASDRNVKAYGLRLNIPAFHLAPFELGFHAYAGYGDVARFSYGINVAYLFAQPTSNHFLKVGLGLSKIDLEDVDANPEEFGPHVGDVSFNEFGQEFKPYVEWEWHFLRFGSLFAHAGYRVINGDKSVVTGVEQTGDSVFDRRVTDRDYKFFYSASGFEFGLGLSIRILSQ